MNVAGSSEQMARRVKEAIRFGESRESIVAAMCRTFGPDLGVEEVEQEVNAIIDDFPDYELIQMVFRSKVVKEIDGRDCLILDPKSRTAVRITTERLRELVHRKVDISDKIVTCTFKYDPYSMKQLYQSENGVWVYNQYRPPFWQSSMFYSHGLDRIEPEQEMPQIYERFLSHLVDNDKRSYDYIVDWLANALQARNFCILTTIGSQGVGKGTLGEVMRALVGDENFSETGNRILAERFNAQIKNKRIVYCDEASIKSQKEEERLKALVNSALEVEAKGKDAERITNFASFYFSSNSLDAVRLTADDRRFSIVNLTDKKLIEAFKAEEIKALTSQENIDKLARYLYFRDVDPDKMLNVFISERTEQIRSAGLAAWHDWFLDEYCVDNAGQTIKVDDVAKVVEDKYGSKFRPSKKAFMELSKIYPAKFRVYKPLINDRQVWAIQFKGSTDAEAGSQSGK